MTPNPWTIRVWSPDGRDRWSPGWKTVRAKARTRLGATTVANRSSRRYGGMRHPDVGPRYGTIWATSPEGVDYTLQGGVLVPIDRSFWEVIK